LTAISVTIGSSHRVRVMKGISAPHRNPVVARPPSGRALPLTTRGGATACGGHVRSVTIPSGADQPALEALEGLSTVIRDRWPMAALRAAIVAATPTSAWGWSGIIQRCSVQKETTCGSGDPLRHSITARRREKRRPLGARSQSRGLQRPRCPKQGRHAWVPIVAEGACSKVQSGCSKPPWHPLGPPAEPQPVHRRGRPHFRTSWKFRRQADY
jgi:hypothetical protein